MPSGKEPQNACKCMKIHQEREESEAKTSAPGDSTNSLKRLYPAPSRYLSAWGATPLWRSRARRGVSSRWHPMSAKRELVPLGWKRNTHTSSRRAISLSPPSASSSTTTTSSFSPDPQRARGKRFSSTSTWLLHFEAAPGSL